MIPVLRVYYQPDPESYREAVITGNTLINLTIYPYSSYDTCNPLHPGKEEIRPFYIFLPIRLILYNHYQLSLLNVAVKEAAGNH